MGRILVAFAILGSLAACSTGPKTVAKAPPGISYRVQGNDMASANYKADQYCSQYGTHARLDAVNPAGTDNIAVYSCQ